MDSKKRNTIIAVLLIALSALVIAMCFVPFQFTYSKHGSGPYIISGVGFFQTYSQALRWYGYLGGDEGHVVQVVMAILTALSLVLGPAGIVFGILALVKPDNKKVKLFGKVITITTLSICSVMFAGFAFLSVITVIHKHRIIPLFEIPYLPFLVLAIIALVCMHKEKKAQLATAE